MLMQKFWRDSKEKYGIFEKRPIPLHRSEVYIEVSI